MLIAVDVDLTVTDTLSPWLMQFQLMTGRRVLNLDHNYSLEPEMLRIMADVGLSINDYDPMELWDRSDLYDSAKPLPLCQNTLHQLNQEGHDIVFVSSCIAGHIDSKKRFLDRYFPYSAGFIDTVDKHWVNYDVLIDDRIKHMALGQKHRPNAKHIMFTGVREDGMPDQNKDYVKAATWSEVSLILN